MQIMIHSSSRHASADGSFVVGSGLVEHHGLELSRDGLQYILAAVM